MTLIHVILYIGLFTLGYILGRSIESHESVLKTMDRISKED